MSDSPTPSSFGRTLLPRFEARLASPRLSVSQAGTPRWTLAQDVMACEEVGLPALGLVRGKLEHDSAADGFTALLESDVVVSSLTWQPGFTGFDGRTFEEALEDACDAIRLAGLVGARTLVLDPGARGTHILSHARRILDEALVELTDEAERHHVRIALRPLHAGLGARSTYFESLGELDGILDDHITVGVVLDTRQLAHERRRGCSVGRWARRTAVVQWHQCDNPSDDESVVTSAIDELVDAGFHGDVEIVLSAGTAGDEIGRLMDARHRCETALGIGRTEPIA